jgi:hypothetical protein
VPPPDHHAVTPRFLVSLSDVLVVRNAIPLIKALIVGQTALFAAKSKPPFKFTGGIDKVTIDLK